MKSCILLCVAAAGCASDSSSATTGVPGIAVDTTFATAVSALSRGDAHPCHYDHNELSTATDQPDSARHSAAKISYNAAGLDVLEDEVDDAGGLVLRLTSEYGAMGNVTHWLMAQPIFNQEVFNQEGFLAYDSFGRLIRYEIDDDNGTSTATYTHGNHNLRATAHLTRTDRPERGYDRTYTYDAQDRVIRLDRDIGFDGTIDESDRYVYDDVARTATMDTVNAAGTVLKHTDFTYDDDGHVTSEVSHSATDTDIEDSRYDRVYEGGKWISGRDHYRDASADGTLVFVLDENYDYQYSCR